MPGEVSDCLSHNVHPTVAQLHISQSKIPIQLINTSNQQILEDLSHGDMFIDL